MARPYFVTVTVQVEGAVLMRSQDVTAGLETGTCHAAGIDIVLHLDRQVIGAADLTKGGVSVGQQCIHIVNGMHVHVVFIVGIGQLLIVHGEKPQMNVQIVEAGKDSLSAAVKNFLSCISSPCRENLRDGISLDSQIRILFLKAFTQLGDKTAVCKYHFFSFLSTDSLNSKNKGNFFQTVYFLCNV